MEFNKYINLFIIIIQLTIISNVLSLYSTKECENKSFKCYNGGSCIQIAINSTSTIEVCSCKPGYTGRQCEHVTMPCSPDPCAPNGYCNSGTIDIQNEQNIYVSISNTYFCRCKPGFTGYNCQENINDCINATCANGGLCIDGINSYTCDCPWPYSGRYCETKLTCSSNFCKNNSTCVEEYNHSTKDLTSKCMCQIGYEGIDCSIKLDACKKKPCLFGGKCLLTNNNNNDYLCKCPLGRVGKNCQLMDICYIDKPCKNNGTCIQLDIDENIDDSIAVVDISSYIATTTTTALKKTKANFICECKAGYTGINCDIYLNNCANGECHDSKVPKTTISTTPLIITELLTITTITTNTVTISESLPIPTNSLLNGSFVLILNLTPDEFKRRKYEIIQEFSKQMGIFMLIKKDTNSQEMIYPYEYSSELGAKKLLWTKVYFIIIFACIDQTSRSSSSSSSNSVNEGNICLSDLNSLNDVFNFVSKLREATNLPNYVSNITYEANEIKSGNKNVDLQQISNNQSPIIIISVVVTVLVTIIVLLGMIVRQQQIKNRLIKAPVWFPPYSGSEKLDVNTNQIQTQINAPHTNASSWSFQSSVKNFFKLNHQPDSPKSDENCEKPLKMRKIDNNNLLTTTRDSSTPLFHGNSSTSSNCTTSSEYLSSSLSPPALMGCVDLYYPSPPESLPDFYSNIKGPQGLTPIMCIIMNHKSTSVSNMLDMIEMLVSKGADLNSVNTSNGETALQLAARNGLYEICEKLINYGADITIYDKQGRNVLHTAVGSNQYSIIKLLFMKFGDKIDIDAKTNDSLGENALISASRNHYNDLVKLLISYNATINSTDNNGQSALHWCAKVNNCQGAILLLENGANINLQDENEKTPLSVAIDELNTNEIIQLLIKYQAFVSSEDEKLIEFKQKLLNQTSNNNLNLNIKQIKETNLITAANILNKNNNNNNKIKIEKELNNNNNTTNNEQQNRKRKLNNTDISITTNNNKASKTSKIGNKQQASLEIKSLKSEANLLTSTPCGTLTKNSDISKSIQENLNFYNTYDYLTNLNTLANKNLTSSVYNINSQYPYQQQTFQQLYPQQQYQQQYDLQQQQQQQYIIRQQDYNYSTTNTDNNNTNSIYNNYQQPQQQQQQTYSNYYSNNNLITANTTNTAYF